MKIENFWLTIRRISVRAFGTLLIPTIATITTSSLAVSGISSNTKIYFQEVPNAITINLPFPNALAITTIPIDINHDGKDDLVVHLWSGQYSGQNVGDIPCPNEIRVLTYQSDNTFVDQTSTYITGTTDLGGCSRKVRIADINQDGKLDLVYAINQEDGRLQSVSTDMNAQMAALVSVGNHYEIKKFGVPTWYHSVGIGYDTLNKPFVYGNGYSGNNPYSYYFDSTASSTDTGLVLPFMSPTAFEFLNNRGDSSESTWVLQANNSSLAYTSVEGFIKRTDGTWSQLTSYSLAPQVGTVQGVCYTGDPCGTNPVFSINGKYITFAGLSESCQFKISPTSNQSVAFKIGGGAISNFVDGAVVRQTDLQGYSTLGATSINGNQIASVPLNIAYEQTDNINSNFFDCKDVNGDGFQDFVVYPYNSNGLPFVYLNNKDGGFNYAGQNQFPLINDQWGMSATSILHDFDKDGIADLVIFPANGITSNTPVSFRFFKGVNLLEYTGPPRTSQTISFGTAPTIAVGLTGIVSANASSSLAVSLTSTSPDVCSISGTSVTGIAVGTCTIAANQSGDASFYPANEVSQGILVIEPSNVESTTSLVANPNQGRFGKALTLTASVNGMYYKPTGRITFIDGVTPLGTVDLVNGRASLAPALSSGLHALSASFSGDIVYLSSVGTLNYFVSGSIDVSLSIQLSPNPSTAGKSVLVSAGVNPATYLGAVTGTIDISGGGQACTIALPATTCHLIFKTSGQKSITATYGGSELYAGSSATVTQKVGSDITPLLMLLLD